MSIYLPLSLVRKLAARQGFADCGASKAESLPSGFFSTYLNQNFNAGMQFLERNIENRLSPVLLFPSAKTIFSFVFPYHTAIKASLPPFTASFAMMDDYHRTIKSKLNAIVQSIKEIKPDFKAKVCVDTAPVFEKIWAKRANLGTIGKNSLFISRTHGSKVLLGEIICNMESDYPNMQKVEINNDVADFCLHCDLCVKACPNSALEYAPMLDARRCISYLTQWKGITIPPNIDLKGYIHGCDICLDVCPHRNGISNFIFAF
ncbi:MAG: DUF1730 domain-containing protein [Bacteroidales bacterium]|jgi:epoxyqueuosine reductase|nr:DUF1730 domain-containing protein [Bacteroidales bacterium]